MKLINNSEHNSVSFFKYFYIFLLIILISSSIVLAGNAQEELKRSIQIINPRPDFTLSLRLDKGAGATYSAGERISVYFRSTKNSYVTIFGYDASGNIRMLFPNQFQRDNYVRANQEYSIDGVIDRASLPGIEYIQGFATTEQIILTRELERRLSSENNPIVEQGISRFTLRIRGILLGLSSNEWVSSETIHYQVIDRRSENGQLRISSSPSGADVYLSDRYAGKTPLSLDQVRAGEYLMRVEIPGYQPWSRTVRINPNRATTMHADLEMIQQFGSIVIRSNVENARIYLDGQYKGRTERNANVILDNITDGFHDLMVTLDGYQDWNQRIQVRPNQRLQLNINMDRIVQTGSIVIRSNVDNARIYLDGQYKGQTERNKNILLENIPEGYHDIRITLDGYIEWSQSIQLRPNQRVQLNVNLERALRTGNLEVISNVDNAMVYLDDIYYGRTASNRRIIINDLEEGSYKLTLTKEGYQDFSSSIRINAGQTNSINIRMQQEQRNGSIAISCNENNARIFINGVYKTTTSINQTRIIDDLEQGIYEIAVIKDGFRTWLDEISVYPNQATSVYVNLVRVSN